MPSNARSSHWVIRVDEIDGVTRERVSEWCSANDVLLCVREDSDSDTPNPHYHMLVAAAEERSEITVREKVKKAFGVSKAQLSVKPWTTFNTPRKDDKIWLYTCKGPSKVSKQPVVVVFHGTLDDVQVAHETYWQKRVELVESSKKAKKNVKADVVAALLRVFDPVQNPDAPAKTKRNLVFEAVRFYKGKCSDFQLIPVVQSVWWHWFPTEVEEDAYDRVARRLEW